jgi:hypothetical protein
MNKVDMVNFYPEVHLVATKLVIVVLTVHFVVRRANRRSIGSCKNQHSQVRILNDTLY